MKNKTQYTYRRHTIYLVYEQFFGVHLAPPTRGLGRAWASGRNTKFRLKISVPILLFPSLPLAKCDLGYCTNSPGLLGLWFPGERSNGFLFVLLLAFVLVEGGKKSP